MSGHFRYFVEGECEKAFVKAFMFCDGDSFCEGQVEVFNFVNERFPITKARTIQRESKIAIVVDTDVDNIDILEANIKTLENVAMIVRDNIYIVLSINNFEDELVFSCSDISSINQIFGTKGMNEFKNKFIKHNDLRNKLLKIGFDIVKIWSRNASNKFSKYNNDGKKIKELHK